MFICHFPAYFEQRTASESNEQGVLHMYPNFRLIILSRAAEPTKEESSKTNIATTSSKTSQRTANSMLRLSKMLLDVRD